MQAGATEALVRTRETVIDLAGIVAQLAAGNRAQAAGLEQLGAAARAISRGRPAEADALLEAAGAALRSAQEQNNAVFLAVLALLDGLGAPHG